MHDAFLLTFLLLIAAYVALLGLIVVAITHIVFHTWRRLERKHPRAPSPPPPLTA